MSRAYEQAICTECSNKMKNISWWAAKEWYYNNMGCVIDTPTNYRYYQCIHCNNVDSENMVRIAIHYLPYSLNAFKFWDGPNVENSQGVFHLTAHKFYCDNHFRFVAKQIAVKHDGKIYYVNNNLRTVFFPIMGNIKPVFSANYSADMPEVKYKDEYELQKYTSSYFNGYKYVKDYYENLQEELRRM